jgi:hypothetical protein
VNDTLPTKLSELAEISLQELEAVERDPRYHVWMGVFAATGMREDKCSVCMAGAVLCNRLGYQGGNVWDTDDLDSCVESVTLYRKLLAIDALRIGNIDGAQDLMLAGVQRPYESGRHWTDSQNNAIVDYHDNPKIFKRQFREFIQDLKRRGL